MSNWNQFISLKCDSMPDFPAFYSKAQKLISKLLDGKSIAVTDDVFLKCYFSKIITVPELQDSVKEFVKESAPKYEVVLENVRSDYSAQSVSDALKSGGTNGHLFQTKSRRVTSQVDGSSSQDVRGGYP